MWLSWKIMISLLLKLKVKCHIYFVYICIHIHLHTYTSLPPKNVMYFKWVFFFLSFLEEALSPCLERFINQYISLRLWVWKRMTFHSPSIFFVESLIITFSLKKKKADSYCVTQAECSSTIIARCNLEFPDSSGPLNLDLLSRWDYS